LEEKILFWLDAGYTQFGIAKFLKNILDSKFFAIVDTNKGKDFFENQKIVDFEKIWFYRDCFDLNKKININFLTNFEKTYDLNLWKIIYSDVHFNKYNKFYKFNIENILLIVEQQIRFFEKIIEQIKPDFLIIRTTDYAKNQILHQMCKMKKIPILSLGHSRLGNKCIITEDNDLLDNHQKTVDNKINSNYNWDQLQIYLDTYSKSQKKMVKTYQNSNLQKILAFWHFATLVFDSKYRKYYEHKGWNIVNLLKNEFFLFFYKKIRKRFLDKYSLNNIPSDEKYVYFPLQFEPERTILISAPYYTNQLELIKNIARSIPIDYFLYVKEHPGQSLHSWRKTEYYEEILKIPNVKLIHHSIPSKILVEKSDLVATVTGTVGLEAAFLQKPSIVFGDSIYSELSFVYRVKNIIMLPEIIRSTLKKKVDINELQKFMNLIDNNSFEFDIGKMNLEIDNLFHFDAFLQDVKIDNKKMSMFLAKNSKIFVTLANEHKKKIHIYKNLK
jgi:hypothetical protein